MVRVGRAPESLSGGMRTVDPGPGVGASRLEDFEPRYLVERAAAVIQQMELAWDQEISSEDSRCRLGFGETPNCLTGEPGIIVRRLLEPGRYSGPLAELLVPAGEFENLGKDVYELLGWSLSKRRVRIVVYGGEGETPVRPAVFAVVVDEEDTETVLADRPAPRDPLRDQPVVGPERQDAARNRSVKRP